ncbi:MAG: Asp23/Gls24 family envelope stress response protein [Nitrospirales bacterium]
MTEGITTTNNPGQRVPQLGKTTISDEVVAQLVEIATREVQGIHGIAKQGMGEQIAGLTQRLTGKGPSGQGIMVEVGEREVAIDLRIIADYGVKVPDLAANLRQAIIERIERLLGLMVKEVNIQVSGLFYPEDKPAEAVARRVE